MADRERIPVDLDSYIFELIEYDPTENPRGIVTADEWNTILSLLRSSTNYTSQSLQEIVQDLYTATELSSTEPGASGAALIGVEPIAGLPSTLDLEGNVSEALKEIVQQMQNIALGEIPAGSLTAEKFAPNLNFTGDSLTFNDFQILTQNDIVQELDENSSDKKVLSALASYNFLNEKQDNISVGTVAPNEDTKGNIYIQLDNDIKEYYTKEETDELLKAKQPNLTAGSNITITNNVISAANVTKIPAASSVFQIAGTGVQSTDNGNGGSVVATHRINKPGYYPLAISGYTSNAVNEYNNTSMGPGIRDVYLSERGNGTCVVYVRTFAANNQAWTYHVDYSVEVLWVKIS